MYKVLILGFLIGLFLAFLFYCRIKDKNKLEEKIQSASFWIKSADELAKEAKIEYLKKHKRKISPEAAKIYNEQLAFYKQNANSIIGSELKWFNEAIEDCDMERATRLCKNIWSTDAKVVVNDYLMSRLFKIHDCYE